MGLTWPDLGARSWQFTDLVEGTGFDREGGDLQSEGLFVRSTRGSPPWQCDNEVWLALAKRHFTGGS